VPAVAQPGTGPLEVGHAAALLAALCFAMTTLFTKQIMRTDTVLCVLFWMTVSQAAMSLAVSLPGGIPLPSASMIPWLIMVGLSGLSAHLSLTSALGHAPASIVAPMEFLRLPVLAGAGIWLYGEPLRLSVFIGAAMILSANLINMRGRRQTRRT
jgi:drug/metabolite transporter (DMT)-like permease